MLIAKNDYYIVGNTDTVVMTLTQNQVCFLYLRHLPLVAPYCWSATWNTKTRSFYARANTPGISAKSQTILMHRIIMGLDFADTRQVDHLYHATLDNRDDQMMVKTSRGNSQNRLDNKTGSPGVSWNSRRERFVVQIQVTGNTHNLGYFTDVESASASYQDACNAVTEGNFTAWLEEYLLSRKRPNASWDKQARQWRSAIRVDGKLTSLGFFGDNQQSAVETYWEAYWALQGY